ncbi:hypothetical protein PPROV_000136700 [Pycnococcus provasolii]|uniref:Exportin-5 C-terminal domain-containing protein n=2 Tax=Pycnococcus provasolii TaxID=41880 RepID=A0A830HAJ1_9CHLO|nr:hypothetical protein PPROV_000136700 [Pycnococcus provasolii]
MSESAASVVSLISVLEAPFETQANRAAATASLETYRTTAPAQIIAHDAITSLVHRNQPTAVRNFGFAALTHVVRARWNELNENERVQMLASAMDLWKGVAAPGDAVQEPWLVRTKASALLADACRRVGTTCWADAVETVKAHASAVGPNAAELACLFLSSLPDEIVNPVEEATPVSMSANKAQPPTPGNLSGSSVACIERASLISTLFSLVDSIMPFLYTTLEKSFSAAVAAGASSETAHVAAVQAALSTAAVYAEWTPVTAMHRAGMFDASAAILKAALHAIASQNGDTSVPPASFVVPAVEVLRATTSRKRSDHEHDPFDAAMHVVVDALVYAGHALLDDPRGASWIAIGGPLEDVATRVCDALSTFGITNPALVTLGAVEDPEAIGRRARYLEILLAFLRVPRVQLAAAPVPAWIAILKHAMGSLPEGCLRALLHAAAEQLMRRPSKALAGGLSSFASAYCGDDADDLDIAGTDLHSFLSQYRSQMMELIRLVCNGDPEEAASAANSFLESASALPGIQMLASRPAGEYGKLLQLQTAAAPGTPEAAVSHAYQHFQASVEFVESVHGSLPFARLQAAASGSNPTLAASLGATAKTLLAIKWTEPWLASLHARALESFGRYLRAGSPLLISVVSKLFEDIVQMEMRSAADSGGVPGLPPPFPDLAWRACFGARQRCCTAMLNTAATCPLQLQVHLKDLETQVATLWAQGQLRHGERNSLGEMLLAVASAGSPETRNAMSAAADPALAASLARQKEVVDWMMSSLHVAWGGGASMPPYASGDVGAFLTHFCAPLDDASAAEAAAAAARIGHPPPQRSQLIGGTAARWAVYHEVHMIERVLRRTANIPYEHPLQHPFDTHAPWAMRHIFGILVALNKLYSAEGRTTVARAGMSALLEMTESEVHVVLGQSAMAVAAAHKEEDLDGGGVGGVSIYSTRQFLRGLRDGCYQVLAIAATRCPKGFYGGDAHARGAEAAASLLTCLESIEHRHLRLFLRSAIGSIVRCCPKELRGAWITPLLPPLVSHLYARLQDEWARVGVGASQGAAPAATETTAEVVYERLVRDTTREFASLMASMASPDTGTGGMSPSSSSPNLMPKAGSAGAAIVALEQAYSRKSAGGTSGEDMGEPRSVLEWLLVHQPATGACVIQAAATILCWPDREAAQRAAPVCRAAIALATRDDRLVELTATHVLSCIIACTRVDVHNSIHPEALSMIREVVMRLSNRTSTVQQTFALTTGATPAAFAELDKQVRTGGSEKKLRELIRGIITSGAAIPVAAADVSGGGGAPKNVIALGDKGAKVAAQRAAQGVPE